MIYGAGGWSISYGLDLRGVNITGSAVAAPNLAVGSTQTTIGGNNARLDIGAQGTANTPVLSFHSGSKLARLRLPHIRHRGRLIGGRRHHGD